MNKTIKFRLLLIITIFSLLLANCEKESGLPRDGDGNVYDTIRIGTQTWLAENLKTTKYNNGVSIPLVTDNDQWISTTSAAFCWYGNNQGLVKNDYGALYNWWAAKLPYLCPVGYRVPAREDWVTLIDFLGGENIAGGKLKITGTIFWENDMLASNESGFSAVGGGVREHNAGTFHSLRKYGYWWNTSLGVDEANGRRIMLSQYSTVAELGGLNKKTGMSVRCIKND